MRPTITRYDKRQVGHDDGRLCVVKGQHISRVVFLPVITVQCLAFFEAYDAYRDLGVRCQRVANPARYAVARQGGAVQGRISLRKIAKLQRELQMIKSHFCSWSLFYGREALLNQ